MIACVCAAGSSLEHLHDLELTYTSNAMEGNTLTAEQTVGGVAPVAVRRLALYEERRAALAGVAASVG